MPVTCVVGSHFLLKGLSEDRRDRIVDRFSLVNPKYVKALRFGSGFTAEPPTIELAKEIGRNAVELPRGVNLEHLGLGLDHLKVTDRRIPVQDHSKNVYFKDITVSTLNRMIKLHPDQKEIVTRVWKDTRREKKRRPYGNYLLVLPVSGGKTIAAAALAMKLRFKTIVVVHTKLIESHWVRDLNKLFGIPRSDVGRIRENVWKIGEHFTVASVQTLFKRQRRWNELFKQFGTVILDECHVCPARTFYECITNFPARYRIGITGTPKRADAMHKVMYQVFGRPFYKVEDSKGETETSIPIKDVRARMTRTKLPKELTMTITTKSGTEDIKEESQEAPFATLLSYVVDDPKRDRMIVRDVVKCLRAGRSCLITSSRVDHVKRLGAMIQDKTKKKGGVIVGSTPARERSKIERRILKREYRWLCATIQIVSTGANLPPLSRLFMTTPIAQEPLLKQLVGRIRRKHKSKKDAIVYDYVDDKVGLFSYLYFKKRRATYKKLGVRRFKNLFIA